MRMIVYLCVKVREESKVSGEGGEGGLEGGLLIANQSLPYNCSPDVRSQTNIKTEVCC
jgi:hypothetical protein